MTAEIGVNSYVDVAYADAYFAARYGYPLWTTATEAEKNQILVSSAQALDSLCYWYHDVPEDKLAFSDFDPIPVNVEQAQCEIGYKMLAQGTAVGDPADPLTKLKAGSAELQFKASTPQSTIMSDLISGLLAPYGACGGKGAKLVPLGRG